MQVQQLHALAGHISRTLGGEPVRVELCDTRMTPKKKPAPVANP